MSDEARLVWDVRASLGEGPLWFTDEAALRFVDIKNGKLHRYEPSTGAQETLSVGGQPSFVVPAEGDTLLVGSNAVLHHIEDGALGRPAATIDMPAHNRTNDGAVDCFGRVWFGTMDDAEQQPTGKLYCLDGGQLHCLGCDAMVTNGPAVTSDGKTLYFVDSGARRIWRYTIEHGPRLSQGELFLQLGEADGFPDGVVLDSEDCLWVALWDGWSVRRYAPDGRLLMSVKLPCARVTKLAFGGDDLRTAFVTTARVGLDAAQLAAQPLAGALFAFDAPVAGRPSPKARVSL